MRLIPTLSGALLTAALLSATPAARAATEAPYTQQAFAASQQAGKPILVDITAGWCPICAKQHPILSKLTTEPAYQELIVYTVDFDAQKDVVRQLGARMQSTLIVYRGASEMGRSTGDTDAGSIAALLAKSKG